MSTHPLYPHTRGSLANFVGQFEAGSHPSAPPANCTLWGRMGALPGEDPKYAQQQLKDFVLEKYQQDAWLNRDSPEIEFTGYYAEPTEISKDHPICQVLAKSSVDAIGASASIIGHDGAADSRFLNEYGERPACYSAPARFHKFMPTTNG